MDMMEVLLNGIMLVRYFLIVFSSQKHIDIGYSAIILNQVFHKLVIRFFNLTYDAI